MFIDFFFLIDYYYKTLIEHFNRMTENFANAFRQKNKRIRRRVSEFLIDSVNKTVE